MASKVAPEKVWASLKPLNCTVGDIFRPWNTDSDAEVIAVTGEPKRISKGFVRIRYKHDSSEHVFTRAEFSEQLGRIVSTRLDVEQGRS